MLEAVTDLKGQSPPKHLTNGQSDKWYHKLTVLWAERYLILFYSQQQLFPDGLGLYDSLVHRWQSLLSKNKHLIIRTIIMPNRHLGKAKKT
jgi:hypothetical protein